MSCLVVGAVATAIDLLVVALLVEVARLSPAAASLPALFAGMLVQFIGCRRVLGADARGSFVRQLAGFAVAEVGTLGLNAITFHLLVTLTPTPYLPARLLGQALVYVGFSYPAWKRAFGAVRA